MSKEILWYDLVPHYAPDPSKGPFMATAALRKCIMTGATLDTSGGPGFSLSKEAVEAIDMRRSDAKAKAVVELDDLKKILDFTERFGFENEEVHALTRSMIEQLKI